MNIDDIKSWVYPSECWLKAIFARQRELMVEYEKIEEVNGLLLTDRVPVDKNDRFGQARLKDFAWRFMEEIGEALEKLEEPVDDSLHMFKEEVADAMHFLTELTILAGLSDMDIRPGLNGRQGKEKIEALVGTGAPTVIVRVRNERIRISVASLVQALGMTMNCLKNKPWKRTHMETDLKRFHNNLVETWYAFFYFLSEGQFTAEEVYNYYIRKSQVNEFRQRSNY